MLEERLQVLLACELAQLLAAVRRVVLWLCMLLLLPPVSRMHAGPNLCVCMIRP
jgi:hypothetical protein